MMASPETLVVVDRGHRHLRINATDFDVESHRVPVVLDLPYLFQLRSKSFYKVCYVPTAVTCMMIESLQRAHPSWPTPVAVETVSQARDLPVHKFDFAVVHGLTEGSVSLELRNAAEACGRNTLIVENGYIRQIGNTKYHQLSWNTIGHIPLHIDDDDRRLKRYLAAGDRCVSVDDYNSSGDVLLLCQKPYDAQHKMSLHATLCWIIGMARDLGSVFPDRRIVMRPHPSNSDVVMSSPIPGVVESGALADLFDDVHVDITLAESLEQAGIVVTINSTSGVESIMAGKHIICHEAAHYARLSYMPLSFVLFACDDAVHHQRYNNNKARLAFHMNDLRRRYLCQLANSQWCDDELRAVQYLGAVLGQIV